MRRSLWITTLLLLALLVMIAPASAQDHVAEWTYMQYFNMDNNLESALYNDLIEMQAVGSTDDVNIVAQVDRIDGFETRFGDWTDTKRFRLVHEEQPVLDDAQKIEEILMLIYQQPGEDPAVLRGQLEALRDSDAASYMKLLTDAGVDPNDQALIDRIVVNRGLGQVFSTDPLQDLGEIDMGDPQSLVDFVTWAVTNYPAKHYALTISTHGAGWMGNGPDDTSSDILQLPELVQALGEIQSTLGIDQFDLLGFDACLMGQLEVYRALTPYTKYILASEEIIPGNGWEYTTPFTQLTENPTMDAETLGKNIVDAYMAYYAGPGQRTKVDLGLIDTNQIPAVVDKLGQFASVADQATVDKLSALGVARTNAQMFDTSTGDVLTNVSSADLYSSVDLISFMALIAGQPDVDPDLKDAAQGVIDAAQTAIIQSDADNYLPDAHGMAIYFPVNSRMNELPSLVMSDLTPYPDSNPDMTTWTGFLGTLHSTIDTALLPDALKITVTKILPEDGTASIYDPPVAFFDTDGAGIASLMFVASRVMDDGTQWVVDTSPLVFETVLPDGRAVDTFPTGVSEGNTFAWNVETLQISDGATQIPSVLWINKPGTPEGVINGTYISGQSGQQMIANVVFNTDTRTALTTYGTGDDGQVSELQTQPGDKFVPNVYYYDTDGSMKSVAASDSLAYGVNPFTYSYTPAPSGDYQMAMFLQDLAGNLALSSKTMKVDNTGLDTAWRGYKDVYTGINFLYPWDWTDPTVLADENGQPDQIEITDPNGDMRIYIAMRDTTVEQATSDMYDLEAGLTDAVVDDPVELDDSTPGIGKIITYSYTGDSGEARSGAVFIVRVESNNATYTLDVDAPDTMGDQAVAILTKMADTMTFFTPVS